MHEMFGSAGCRVGSHIAPGCGVAVLMIFAGGGGGAGDYMFSALGVRLVHPVRKVGQRRVPGALGPSLTRCSANSDLNSVDFIRKVL